MAKEIERKFLVNMALWRAMAAGTLYRQGYLSSVNERVVRVRIAGDHSFTEYAHILSYGLGCRFCE